MNDSPAPRLAQLWADCQPATLMASFVASLVIAITVLVGGLGVAALVFTGPLQEHIFLGVGLVLVGTAALMAIMAMGSSWPGTIGAQQEVPAVLLGLVATAVYAALTEQMPGSEALPYVVVSIAVATVATGAAFYLLGYFRLGALIRYIPYPVVGGMLAGLGRLMIQGGLAAGTGVSLGLETLADFSEADMLARVAAAAGVAVLLLVATRLSGHYLVMPGTLLLATGLFYLGWWGMGNSAAEAMAADWLLGPFPDAAPWEPISREAVAGMDWGLLLGELPTIATLVVVAAIATLMHASGLELLTRRDLDLDQELRVAGSGNVCAGLLGGVPGFHGMSETSLGLRMGANSRWTGLFTAILLLFGVFLGLSLLAWFPKPVLAGLLFYLGLLLLYDWLVRGWRRLPRGDYAVVVLILLVAGWFGYLEGILVGVLAGVLLFTVSYSRLGIAKHVLDGSVFHSNVDRPDAEREALVARGERIQVIALQGFIFFGTAEKLLNRIRTRLADEALQPLRYLCLDFEHVQGVDSSAGLAFHRLSQMAGENGFELLLAGLSPVQRELLTNSGLLGEAASEAPIHLFDDTDSALEWCEEALLESFGPAGEVEGEGVGEQLLERLSRSGILPYTERLELAAGETLIAQGEEQSGMYFLVRGRVTVKLQCGDERAVRLRTYDAGTVVGEMAFYGEQRRTASVVAETPLFAYYLDAAAVATMTAEEPAVAAELHRWSARLLADRLAESIALRRILE